MSQVNLALVTVLVLVWLSVIAHNPTHCNGDDGYRCAKDDYKADAIRFTNLFNNKKVRVKIGLWYSFCGWPGRNYKNLDFTIEPGQSENVHFSAAEPGKFHEMFVHVCEKEGSPIKCVNAVSIEIV